MCSEPVVEGLIYLNQLICSIQLARRQSLHHLCDWTCFQTRLRLSCDVSSTYPSSWTPCCWEGRAWSHEAPYCWCQIACPFSSWDLSSASLFGWNHRWTFQWCSAIFWTHQHRITGLHDQICLHKNFCWTFHIDFPDLCCGSENSE